MALRRRKSKTPAVLADVPSGDPCRIAIWVVPGSSGGKSSIVWCRAYDDDTDTESQVLRGLPADTEVLEVRPRERSTDYETAGEMDPLRRYHG